MSFRHIDLASALTRLAERRIEDAMKEGKFDHLPGAGRPLELEDPPADEDARLLWWALRLLRDSQFIPDEIRWRKQIALMKIELSKTEDETRLRSLVRQINDLVLKLNTLGTNAIRSAVTGVDEGEELRRLHERRSDHFHL